MTSGCKASLQLVQALVTALGKSPLRGHITDGIVLCLTSLRSLQSSSHKFFNWDTCLKASCSGGKVLLEDPVLVLHQIAIFCLQIWLWLPHHLWCPAYTQDLEFKPVAPAKSCAYFRVGAKPAFVPLDFKWELGLSRAHLASKARHSK